MRSSAGAEYSLYKSDNLLEYSHIMKGSRNPERSFGVSVGALLALVALVLLWRGRHGRAEIVGAVGALLLLCGLIYPAILMRPGALWWRCSRMLEQVNTRVLLTLIDIGGAETLHAALVAAGVDPSAASSTH